MEPSRELLDAAENTRRSYKESSIWAEALDGARARVPSASVEPLRSGDIPYFLLEFARGGVITARFALSADGVLLEAEGVKKRGAALRPFIDADAVRWWAARRPLRLVWQPCEQSTTRLRPLWEVSDDDAPRYIRADGVFFSSLTVNIGRG